MPANNLPRAADTVNVSGGAFLALTAAWEDRLAELYEQAKQTFSSAVTRFIARLSSSLSLVFGDVSQPFTIRQICGFMRMKRTQVREHLRRAIRAGVLVRADAGQAGIRLQLVLTALPKHHPESPAPSLPSATAPSLPSPSSPSMRDRAAEIRAKQKRKAGKIKTTFEQMRAWFRSNLQEPEIESIVANEIEAQERRAREAIEADIAADAERDERERVRQAEQRDRSLMAAYEASSSRERRRVYDAVVATMPMGLLKIPESRRASSTLFQDELRARLLPYLRGKDRG